MRILLGLIAGGLVGVALGFVADILLANAFMNPIGDDPEWAAPVRYLAFGVVVLVCTLLGASRAKRMDGQK